MSEHSHPDRTETILPLPGRLGESDEWLVENNEKLVENNERLVENNERLVENNERLVEKVIERATKYSVKVTEKRISIIREIINNPYISKAELSQIVGISTTAIDKNIAVLRDKLIRRIGPNKGGRWEVIID